MITQPTIYTAVVGTVGRQVRITAKDHTWEKTLAALAQLKEARRTRQNYDDLLQAAIKVHGDLPPGKSAISGIYAEHFPETVKGELRTLAHNIGVQVEHAYALWRQAGRRAQTLRPFADDARILKDGRRSYY